MFKKQRQQKSPAPTSFLTFPCHFLYPSRCSSDVQSGSPCLALCSSSAAGAPSPGQVLRFIQWPLRSCLSREGVSVFCFKCSLHHFLSLCFVLIILIIDFILHVTCLLSTEQKFQEGRDFFLCIALSASTQNSAWLIAGAGGSVSVKGMNKDSRKER